MDVQSTALHFTAALLALALGTTALVRVRSVRTIGAPIAAERGGRSPLLLLPIAAAFVVVLLAEADPLPLVVVVGAAAFHFASPQGSDRVLCERGLRRGWFSLRFEDIEAWRLTGDHLRVMLRGEWEAVPAPANDHVELRKVLEERAPGRESRFTS